MYKGNENLRRAGENIDYTPEMIEEVMRCAEDPIHFAEAYFTVIHPDRGQELIKLYEFQKKMIKAYVDTPNGKSHSIVCVPRQAGKTTVTTIFLLWFALFNKDKTIAIIANKEDIAKEILKRIKTAYENLPLWIQVGLKDGGWAEKKIELGNGSRLVAASTSPSSISGLSVSLLFIDEFAKIDRSKQEEFITATYPVISAGKKSKIIIVSTPLGVHNVFYEFWSKAVRGLNNFFPIKVSWKDHPERDMEWKRKVLADIGPVRFRQEYECLKGNTLITVKDKITNKIIKITIEDFYNKYLN